MITNYSVNWIPGVANSEFKAIYTLDFSANQDNIINLVGSYNGHQVDAKTLYVNNKQNSNIVTVNANVNNFTREIPPNGEAYLQIEGYQSINIYSDSGQCEIEIRNTPTFEKIFQRTDALNVSIQAENPFGCLNNDLVTIDLLGRYKTCVAATLAGNNTTANFPVSARVFPANTMSLLFNGTGGTARIAPNGNMVGVGHNGAAWCFINQNILGANNTVVLVNRAYAADCPNITESMSYYYVSFHGIGEVYRIAKIGFAVVKVINTNIFAGVPYTFQSVITNGLNTDNFSVLGQNANAFKLNFNSAGVFIDVNPLGNILPGGSQIFVDSYSNGNILVISGYRSGTVAHFYCVINLSVFSVMYSNTDASAGQSPLRLLDSYKIHVMDNGNTIVAHMAASTLIVLHTCNTAGNVSVSNVTGGAVLARGYTSIKMGDALFVVRANATPSVIVDKFDNNGIRLNTVLVVNAGMTKIYSANNIGGYILIGIDGTAAKNVIFDDDGNYSTELPLVTSALVSLFQIDYLQYMTMFSATNTKVTYDNVVAQSIFGVFRGTLSVGLTGYFNINQKYFGSNSFNQNAAAVIGNKGLVINNVAKLDGLT